VNGLKFDRKYDRICIMLPTYGRSRTKLPKFIESALATVSDVRNICFCFLTNEKDIESDEAIHRLCNGRVDYEILHENYGSCHLGFFFNYIFDTTKFMADDICVSMFGDDMVFVTNGWDAKKLDKINDMAGFGIVYGDDDYYQHDKMCVYFITTRWYIRLTGKPFMHPAFAADWIDTIHYKIAEKLRCLWYIPDLHIKHEHFTFNNEMDDTARRNRVAAVDANKLNGLVNAYVDEAVGSVQAKIMEAFPVDLGVVMTTYDRVPLLERTVKSWNDSCFLPSAITICDDKSERREAVDAIITEMKNALRLPPVERHLGCDLNNRRVILAALSDLNYQGVLVLDSDTGFSGVWFLKAIELWKLIRDNSGYAGGSLFDARRSEASISAFTCYVEKRMVGGFGTIYKRDFIKKYMEEYDVRLKISWDNYLNKKAEEEKRVFLCTEKSYLQHTGFFMGTHISDDDKSDHADNYVGKPEVSRIITRSRISGRVLFAAMARLGDVVAASMLANMVKEKVELVWVTLPIYRDLVERICPGVKVLAREAMVGGPYGEWSELNSYEMKTFYPGYDAYINAQLGCRENHDEYLLSGKTPCDFLRMLCEDAIGCELSTDYVAYLRGPTGRQIEMRLPATLAIISPKAKTSQALTDEMVKEEFDCLKAEGFSPRILVEKCPERVAISETRDKYIFKLNIFECIYVIRQARMFVGNDSGMAWCSLFSSCRKRIYHKKERIARTNTWFSRLDKNAEDILV